MNSHPHDSVHSHKWSDKEALGLLHQVWVRVNVGSLVHPDQRKHVLNYSMRYVHYIEYLCYNKGLYLKP